MSKLIRFDEDHFAYLVDHDVSKDLAQSLSDLFQTANPGRSLIIMQADEFIDLTGKYEIVPIREPLATEPIVGVPV
jgi:hypothetical protein